MYLLDTNVCVQLLANDARVVAQLSSLGRVPVYLPAITVGELAVGAMRSARPAHHTGCLRQFLRHFTVLPVDVHVALEYGVLKSQLAARGQLLEDNDLFIAATALFRGLTLVTHDKGFARVPNLQTEDWLA